MAWHWTSNKPLPKLMVTQSSDTYRCPQPSIKWSAYITRVSTATILNLRPVSISMGLVVRIIASLWNLTGALAEFYTQISWLQAFMKSYDKMIFWILKWFPESQNISALAPEGMIILNWIWNTFLFHPSILLYMIQVFPETLTKVWALSWWHNMIHCLLGNAGM